jgi:hypothetical protein
MKSFELKESQFIVGMILVAVAVLMVAFLGDDYTAGAAGIGIVGLVSIATSRRK